MLAWITDMSRIMNALHIVWFSCRSPQSTIESVKCSITLLSYVKTAWSWTILFLKHNLEPYYTWVPINVIASHQKELEISFTKIFQRYRGFVPSSSNVGAKRFAFEIHPTVTRLAIRQAYGSVVLTRTWSMRSEEQDLSPLAWLRAL